jgi:hypothetical protein
MLTGLQCHAIGVGMCPDCAGELIAGTRGWLGQNFACRGCGAGFKAVRAYGVSSGPVVMGLRNTEPPAREALPPRMRGRVVAPGEAARRSPWRR